MSYMEKRHVKFMQKPSSFDFVYPFYKHILIKLNDFFKAVNFKMVNTLKFFHIML